MPDSGPPLATCRLQFHREFRLDDAAPRVAYFSRLGITHLYASPLLKARRGSMHGYDVVDTSHINAEIGSETSLRALVNLLQKYGLGLILDIVPNHMATSIENPYWRDVLTYGPGSPFARWFDVDWRMPNPELWGRVLAPVLGEPLGKVIEQDQIRVSWSDGRFLIHYFDHIFPIDPATIREIVSTGIRDLEAKLPADHPGFVHIRAILRDLKALPKTIERVRRRVQISRDEIERWLGELARLITDSPVTQEWAETMAARFGEGPEGQKRLRRLLDNQPYRLVHWREAARVINYRRFFDVDELIAVRQEDPQVFQETHNTVFRWLRDGLLDGLRIDHIDGLRDPQKYLDGLAAALHQLPRRERVRIFVEKILHHDEQLPSTWPVDGTTGYEFLNEVEAIFIDPAGFAAIEEMYGEILGRMGFHEMALEGKRRVLQNELSPQVGRLTDILLRLANDKVAEPLPKTEEPTLAASATVDAPDTEVATELAVPRTETAPLAYDKDDVVRVIVETIAALPVYRTYVDIATGAMREVDRRWLTNAVNAAAAVEGVRPEAIELLRDGLLLGDRERLTHQQLRERISFLERFQQLSGPAAAKGVEDTALYAYVPLVSLNEVGGGPEAPLDRAIQRLHDANFQRAAHHPRSMLCVTTHDTKRTADVRARLDVLSEIPEEWERLVKKWRVRHRPLRGRKRVGGKLAPRDSDEYLFYQTALGIWPLECGDLAPLSPDHSPSSSSSTGASEPGKGEGQGESAGESGATSPHSKGGKRGELRTRIEEYMRKAMREGKVRTSWTAINEDYENATFDFIRTLIPTDEGAGRTPFLEELEALRRRIARAGYWNSLSRTLIQYASPGTPDLYQGDELWNFALVDPDNRRPVDYDARQRLLDEVATGLDSSDDVRGAFLRGLVDSPDDGRIKLHVLRGALKTRRDYPALFTSVSYAPLEATGMHAQHVFAFGRTSGNQSLLAVAPRLTARLLDDPAAAPVGEAVWGDTTIALPGEFPRGRWTNTLTRETIEVGGSPVRVADLLRTLPVGLFVGERST